jgi:hypothetical protein
MHTDSTPDGTEYEAPVLERMGRLSEVTQFSHGKGNGDGNGDGNGNGNGKDH